jgi:ribosomal protein S18 acetylase RimI-like enzyme
MRAGEEQGPTIRPGTPEDIDALMGLVADVVAGMRAAGIEQWDEIYPDRGTVENDLRGGALFKWEEGRDIMGMAVLDEKPDPAWAEVAWTIPARRPLVVHRLCVSPRFRGRGLARRMMAFAEAYASERGHDALRLDAFTLNPVALRLYDALGYRRAGLAALRKGIFQCFEKRIDPC